MENIIGKVGIYSIGYIGLIQDCIEMPWGPSYVGVKLSDGSSWASRTPYIIADSIEEYSDKKEKMTPVEWEILELNWKDFMASLYPAYDYRLER